MDNYSNTIFLVSGQSEAFVKMRGGKCHSMISEVNIFLLFHVFVSDLMSVAFCIHKISDKSRVLYFFELQARI